MSYCYADDDTSDPVSTQHHYRHLMPESPLQHKLSTNNSSTNSHVRYVKTTKQVSFFLLLCMNAYVCACTEWCLADSQKEKRKELFFYSL